jgi:uncharacterized protein YpuA (DUF1002 family)
MFNTMSLSAFADSTEAVSDTEIVQESSLAYDGEFRPVVTLGANLTEEQKELILSFFSVDNSIDYEEITITNEDERKYLEGVVDDSIIGTKTLSCAFVMPTSEGGIQVRTANLNWVTDNMIANALLTAGIENCQVIATAPFEVSGTGALTGVLKAYESSTGEELEEDKKQQATEELVISAELTENNDEDAVLEMLNELKEEAIKGELSDNVTDAINEVADEYGVTIPDTAMEKLTAWLEKFEQLTYDIEQFSEAVDKLNNSIKGISETVSETTEEAKGFLARIWEAICNFFLSLFGKGKEVVEDVKDNAPSIFDQVNTDVFKFDGDETIGDSGDLTE